MGRQLMDFFQPIQQLFYANIVYTMNTFVKQTLNNQQQTQIVKTCIYEKSSNEQKLIFTEDLPIISFDDEIFLKVKKIQTSPNKSKIRASLTKFNGKLFKFNNRYSQQFLRLFRCDRELYYDVSRQISDQFYTQLVIISHQSIKNNQISQQLLDRIVESLKKLKGYLYVIGAIKRIDKFSYQVRKQVIRFKREVTAALRKNSNSSKYKLFKQEGLQQNKNLIQIKQIRQIKQYQNRGQKILRVRHKNVIVEKKRFEIKLKNDQVMELSLVEKKINPDSDYKDEKQKQRKTLVEQLNMVKMVKYNRYLVNYYFIEGSDECFYMQYIDRSLKNYMYGMIYSISSFVDLSRQLIEAVHILHESQIVHRDLKMDNILVKEGMTNPRIKIIDYGQCGLMNSRFSKQNSLGCTLPYSPLECAFNQQQGYNKSEIDLWSVVIIIYQFFFKELPVFFSRSIRAQLTQGWKCENNLNLMLRIHPKRGLRVIQNMISIVTECGLRIQQRQRLKLATIDEIIKSVQTFQDNLIGLLKRSF